MSTEGPERPRQVTMAAWTIMVASVLVVIAVWDYIHGLRSLESREHIASILDEPPGSSLGISVPTAIEWLRALAMLTAACAVAMAILGYQVLQRSTSARIVLSVLAVPLFLAGMSSGGLLTALVAASVLMLWLQPSRDWFAGRTPSPRTVLDAPASPPTQTPVPPSGGEPPVQPPQFPAAPAPMEWPSAAYLQQRLQRPPAVLWAAVLTFVFSAITILGMGMVALGLAVARDDLLDEAYRQSPDLADSGLSRGELTAGVFVMAALVIAWALLAILFAVMVLRRAGWARILLSVCSAGAGLFMLVTVLSAPMMVVPVAACIATLVLLNKPESRAWCAPRPAPQAPQPPFTGPGGPPSVG